jgi:hypothetical protein
VVPCTISLGTGGWNGLTSSANGQYLAIVDYGSSSNNFNGYLYTSSNFGSNWDLQNRIGAGKWTRVASDSTGKYIIAGKFSDYIYTSKDFGSNWSSNTILGKGSWVGVTSDSTGKYLVVSKSALPVNGMYTWGESNSYGYIYKSSDYGSNWSETSNAFQGQMAGLTSDSTGRYVAVRLNNTNIDSYILTSSTYGDSWNIRGNSDTESISSVNTPAFWATYSTSRFSTGKYTTAYNNLPSNTLVASSSNGQFIVAGNYNGLIYTSKNYGSNWSSNHCLNPCINAGQTGSDYSSTGMRQNYTWADSNGICVKNNNGAAVCDSSYAAATVQGGCAYTTCSGEISLTFYTTSVPPLNVVAIAYGKDGAGRDLWIAVGGNSAGYTSSTITIASSPDGYTWTPRGNPFSSSTTQLRGSGYFGASGVSYGNGIWVVVGGYNAFTYSQNTILRSSDGITWIGCGNPFRGNNYTPNGANPSVGFSISYGNGLFIVQGFVPNYYDSYGPALLLVKSSDGIVWDNIGAPGTLGKQGGGMYGAAYGKDTSGNDLWIACGNNGYQNVSIVLSKNGGPWEDKSLNIPNIYQQGGRSIAYGKDCSGNGLWICVGYFSTGNSQSGYTQFAMIKSSDGYNWRLPTSNPFGTSDGMSIVYANYLWVACGGGVTIASKDSINWTQVSNTSGMIVYGNGIWNIGGKSTTKLRV